MFITIPTEHVSRKKLMETMSKLSFKENKAHRMLFQCTEFMQCGTKGCLQAESSAQQQYVTFSSKGSNEALYAATSTSIVQIKCDPDDASMPPERLLAKMFPNHVAKPKVVLLDTIEFYPTFNELDSPDNNQNMLIYFTVVSQGPKIIGGAFSIVSDFKTDKKRIVYFFGGCALLSLTYFLYYL